ncbi:MAG: Fic family protein [Proteobacteria bacterium]|nr:Fic family protein [Pseudomonadota bacterium]
MDGLGVPDNDGVIRPKPEWMGRFRGEPGLVGCEVAVGDYPGVSSDQVEEELKAFEEKLLKSVKLLDREIQPGKDMAADQVRSVIDLCAWVHAEWVRIHPFANGNGRTARLWVNFLAMRYGLPPFARLRPRPDDDGYEAAALTAMTGEWEPTVRVFHRMYRHHIRP